MISFRTTHVILLALLAAIAIMTSPIRAERETVPDAPISIIPVNSDRDQYNPIDTAPPLNPCHTVTPVVLVPGVPATFMGSSIGGYFGCSLFPSRFVWEAFTITQCSNVTLDFCGTYPRFDNAWLALAQGCPCATRTYNSVYETQSCSDGNFTINWSGLAAGTYYYPVMSDPATGAYGPYRIHVVANPVSSYCPATAELTDEHISDVVVGDINNSSGPGLVNNYSDFSAIKTQMVQGVSYPITVTIGNSYSSDQCGIWVDWDNDMCFGANEKITVTGTPGHGPYSAAIVAPCNIPVGERRLRIRLTYTGVVAPCGATTYGEVEDYTIKLVAHPVVSPLATVAPDPQYAYYAHAVSPMINTIYVGNFADGFLISDVSLWTIKVNGEWPTNVSLLPSQTGFYCGVLKMQMPLANFIDNYGAIFDTTHTTFTVTGNFNDVSATPFAITGEVSLIGHASTSPGQFIVPPTEVVLPGDFDVNGALDISDLVAILSYIFASGAAPANLMIGDVDCSGNLDIADAVLMISYIFGKGEAPCGR
jgi:hypothetical protein